MLSEAGELISSGAGPQALSAIAAAAAELATPPATLSCRINAVPGATVDALVDVLLELGAQSARCNTASLTQSLFASQLHTLHKALLSWAEG